VDKATGLCCNQTIMLSGIKAAKDYPVPPATCEVLRCRAQQAPRLPHQQQFRSTRTNHRPIVSLPLAGGIVLQVAQAALAYQGVFGPSENAVKTQVWIALSTYILVAIVKKRLHAKTSLYTILQILSLTLFEKTSLLQLLGEPENMTIPMTDDKKLNLFD
jgi:hypothetical protein